jgi:DNA topoisomerase-1
VAARLGNTRAVCRKYYVHPALLEAYYRGRMLPPPGEGAQRGARRGRGAALRRDELAVLQFLQEALSSG